MTYLLLPFLKVTGALAIILHGTFVNTLKMNKYLSFFMIMFCSSGCSVVSKQYFYEPAAAHTTTKEQPGYTKMIYSKLDIPDSSGNNIGSITTSNGIGIPMFMGPAYLPIVPIGIVRVFSKKLRQFEIDITVNPHDGYFMALAVDTNSYKRLRDSLAARNEGTAAWLPTAGCYMIINGSTKVPLRVKEYFMQQTNSHSYRLYADVGFGKVRTLTIITGNPLLDSRLKNLVFTRKKRITHSIYGLS